VILEGLKEFQRRGLDATLLLDDPIVNAEALFFGAYKPNVRLLGKPVQPERPLWRKVLQRLWSPRYLLRALSELKPDLLIANGTPECMALVLESLLAFRRPPEFVCFIHGSPFQFLDDCTKYSLVLRRRFDMIRTGDPVYLATIPVRPPRMGLRRRLALEIVELFKVLAVRRSQCIYVLSEKNKREIELLFGHRNVVVAQAGGFSFRDLACADEARTRTLAETAPSLQILSLSRLVTKKRVDVIIRAFAMIVERNPSMPFVLCVGGRGDRESALRDQIAQLKIQDRVRMLGFVAEDELPALYRASRVFVSADSADFDLTCIQALALGCNLVVSQQFEIPAGFSAVRRRVFVAEASESGIAAALERACRAPCEPLIDNERSELQALTWERYFGAILERSLAKV
jgi:glycosyltransferase involved in cell wall biosynthesis